MSWKRRFDIPMAACGGCGYIVPLDELEGDKTRGRPPATGVPDIPPKDAEDFYG